ncbi:hypothetical protein Tco_1194659 [Tanacetum coccineum]
MDSIILLGQKNTLAEYMILSSADNHAPMLDKDLYDSWKKNGVTRTKKYVELSVGEKIQADCDMKATNIILQVGLMTMNITLKVEQFQVNTKFLNSLPPEWSKFVTDVKLVKDLHTTNFDQLHAYLEQHEKSYANMKSVFCEHYLIACLNKGHSATSSGEDEGQSYSGTGYKSNATSSREKQCKGVRQGLLNARAVKAKDIWLGNALSLIATRICRHDLGVPNGQAIQTIIPNNAAFQTEDLDTYDSDSDDILNAKAVLMANIYQSYGSDVIQSYSS